MERNEIKDSYLLSYCKKIYDQITASFMLRARIRFDDDRYLCCSVCIDLKVFTYFMFHLSRIFRMSFFIFISFSAACSPFGCLRSSGDNTKYREKNSSKESKLFRRDVEFILSLRNFSIKMKKKDDAKNCESIKNKREHEHSLDEIDEIDEIDDFE
jgi:hypothetical protein